MSLDEDRVRRQRETDAGPTVLTIGHSIRSLDELVELLRGHGVERFVDIRSVPRSRHNPQFNKDILETELPARGIAYRHEPRLGGFRKARPDSLNLGLRHAGFRGYADHMQTDVFATALDDLLTEAATARTAVMCAEADPFRCHRRLLADALVARGARVLHISGPRPPRPHRLSEEAVVDERRRVSYPRPDDGAGGDPSVELRLFE